MLSTSPLSPTFPKEWTSEIADAAKAHTARVYPAEAVGVVEGGQYVELVNRSTTPGEDVVLNDDDLIRVANAQVFFHSHPDGIGCPSEADMIYQNSLALPFVVMTWPIFDVFAWGDSLTTAPIVGRGFRHGVHDCYSLVRDWYRESLNITALWNQPRGWEWWLHGQTLYNDNWQKAGFKKIAPNEATQRGDLLLFNFNYPTPMHAAIVHDRDLLLHHMSGARPVDPTRLSGLVPRSRFVRLATMALRFSP